MISNLKASNEASYNLELYGLVNGPVEISNQIIAEKGQSAEITCTAYDIGGVLLDLGTVPSSTVNFLAIERTSGFTLTTAPQMNNINAEISLSIVLTEPIPQTGTVSLGFPYVN